MTRRIVGPLAGAVLVGVVLWQVGWYDRVVDAEGRTHRGRIVERRADGSLVLREKGSEPRTIATPRSSREGLRTALGRLASHPGRAAIGVAFHLIALLAIFARWAVLLRGADLALEWPRVVRLSWVGQFFGVVLPGGVGAGDVVRAMYATRAHPEHRARAVVTVFVDRVVGLVALCIVAAAAALAAPPGAGVATVRAVVLAVLAVAVAGSIVLFSARVRHALLVTRLLRRLPFQRVVRECETAIGIYGARPGNLAAAAGCAFAGHALLLAAFWFYGGALGTWMSLAAVGAAIPVAQMLSAIPGLPGGWGIGDYAFLAFLPAAGVAPATAVALSFTYRTLHALVSIPGAALLGHGRDRIRVPEDGIVGPGA